MSPLQSADCKYIMFTGLRASHLEYLFFCGCRCWFTFTTTHRHLGSHYVVDIELARELSL